MPEDLRHDVVAAVLLTAADGNTATEDVNSIPERVVVVVAAVVVSFGILLRHLRPPAMDIAANSNFVAAAVEHNSKPVAVVVAAASVVGRVGGSVAAVAMIAAGVDSAAPRNLEAVPHSRHEQ